MREVLERSLRFVQRVLSGEVLRTDSETFRGGKAEMTKNSTNSKVFDELAKDMVPDSFDTPKRAVFDISLRMADNRTHAETRSRKFKKDKAEHADARNERSKSVLEFRKVKNPSMSSK